MLAPSAMGEFLYRFIAELELGTPHLVAPDVGASAALFLAARHPGTLRSLLVGGGGAAYPLDVTGTLADIIAAPGIEVFEGQDIRATIGASVEPVAPRDREPDVWKTMSRLMRMAGSRSRRAMSAAIRTSFPCCVTCCPRSACRCTSSPRSSRTGLPAPRRRKITYQEMISQALPRTGYRSVGSPGCRRSGRLAQQAEYLGVEPFGDPGRGSVVIRRERACD